MARSRIDITTEVCPMTWVRVKLALEDVAEGGELEVLLKGDEPLRNIPRNAAADGHEVKSLEAQAGGVSRLLLVAHHRDEGGD